MTKDLGIDIKEMLIRQGWKIEESREMIVIRKQLSKCEKEREDLQRLYVSADHQCIRLMKQLGKSEDEINVLTKKLENAKCEVEEWRKKFDDERKLTDALKKQIDEQIRPPPRQPNPVLSNKSASSIESSSSYSWEHNRQPTKISKGKVVIHKPSIRQITPQKR